MVLPKKWESIKLGNLVDFYNGKPHEDIFSEDGSYFLINSKFISSGRQERKKVIEQRSPLKEGDVAMVMSDLPNRKALAKFFFVNKNNIYTLNQRVCRLCVKDQVISKYLFYFLNRNTYYLKFDNGVSQTNLRKSEVLNCPILLPPFPEQKKLRRFFPPGTGLLN